jgi:hypothetical protein
MFAFGQIVVSGGSSSLNDVAMNGGAGADLVRYSSGASESSGYLWGTRSAANYGVVVDSGCRFVYTTKPNLNEGVGANHEAKIGGTDKLWAVGPFVEPANLAEIVSFA